MAKHRVMYADGSLLGQWDNESERNTALEHSLAGVSWKRGDQRDENNFTIFDQRSGKAVFHVTGPAPDRPASQPKESADNAPSEHGGESGGA